MGELPPVLDFSHDPDGLAAHIRAVLAKPCPHCDRFAPTRQRLVFEFGEYAFDYLCSHCGERRARFYPA